jgi:hypothetical protein
MIPLVDLWLPILVSAAVVTLAAAVLARVMPAREVAGGRGAPGQAFAASLGAFFVYALVISVLVGYLASRTVDPAMHYKGVFRIAATAGILAYAFGGLYGGVWGARPWPAAWRDFGHGVLYGLLTAGPFAWLWPDS